MQLLVQATGAGRQGGTSDLGHQLVGSDGGLEGSQKKSVARSPAGRRRAHDR
jgi:hypothetical protein